MQLKSHFGGIYANPHLKLILFYTVPCALLALVVNTRLAAIFVLLDSLAAP